MHNTILFFYNSYYFCQPKKRQEINVDVELFNIVFIVKEKQILIYILAFKLPGIEYETMLRWKLLFSIKMLFFTYTYVKNLIKQAFD